MNLLDSQKLRINIKTYESTLLNNTCNLIIIALNKFNISSVGPIPLPTKRRIYCVLRSPHVNKDSREHFEIRTHKRIIDIYDPKIEIMQILKNLDIAAGVDIEVKIY